MENDILDSLEDLSYPFKDKVSLDNILEGGVKSVEFSELISWLSQDLIKFHRPKLEEKINVITNPDDSSSFILEISSLLKELNCPYSALSAGPISERFQRKEDLLLLLDYLTAEVQTARMIYVEEPEKGIQLVLRETPTAEMLKKILVALGFPKPPHNITSQTLFQKTNKVLQDKIAENPQWIKKSLFSGTITSAQWKNLADKREELQLEYRVRREMMIHRLDVTIQAFQWKAVAIKRLDDLNQVYSKKRNELTTDPNVTVSDILAAKQDILQLKKTSSASVRLNTKSAVNQVRIGRVPDRGGRPSEQQPPPPEMPSWQQRQVCSSQGPRGGMYHGQSQGPRGGMYQAPSQGPRGGMYQAPSQGPRGGMYQPPSQGPRGYVYETPSQGSRGGMYHSSDYGNKR